MFTTAEELGVGAVCPTPGMRIRSRGAGRGMARGGGYGPIGRPISGDLMPEGVETSLLGLDAIMSDEGFDKMKKVVKWTAIIGGGLLAVAGVAILRLRKR